MPKDLTVVIAASGERKDIRVDPGTTPEDILAGLGLEGYAISKDGSSASFFQRGENVYPLVEDGGKLWASLDPKVGGAEGFGPPASLVSPRN